MPLSSPLPYVARPYDSSRSDARMADLMRYRGEMETRAVERAGDRRARTIQGIGQSISGNLGDLIKYREEAPQRELQQRRIEDEIRQRNDADRFRELDATLAGATDDDRAKAYEQAGFRSQAEELRDKASRRQITELEKEAKGLDNQTKALKQAGDILSAIKSQKDPGARGAAYASAVPHLRKLVPYMADQIPDAFSDDFLDIGAQWGKTEAEKLAEAREAALKLDADLKAAKSKAEVLLIWQENIGKQLAQSRDVNQWDETRLLWARRGAPDDVISQFGEDFTPEALRHASDLAKAARKNSSSSSNLTEYEKELARYAARLGKEVDELTQAEENSFKATNAALGRKPDDNTVSDSTIATAERWKNEKLAELGEAPSNPARTADYMRERNAIWRSYYDQIQAPPNKRPNDFGRDMNPRKPPTAPTAPRAAAPTVPSAPTSAPTSMKDSRGRTFSVNQTVYVNGEPRKIVGFQNGQPVLAPK